MKLFNKVEKVVNYQATQPILTNHTDSGSEISLFIFGEISSWWGVNKDSVYSKLKGKTFDQINVYISSEGGEVIEALVIHDLLKGHSANVTAYLTGLCASAATQIACAADTVVMSRQCIYMIHEVQGWGSGSAEELRKSIELIELSEDIIIEIYKRKTNLSEDRLRQMMKEETWMDAETALSLNFVDEVVDAIEVDFQIAEGDNNYYVDDYYSYWNKGKTSNEVYRAAVFNYLSKGYKPFRINNLNQNNIDMFGQKAIKAVVNFLQENGMLKKGEKSEKVVNSILENTELAEELKTDGIKNMINEAVAEQVAEAVEGLETGGDAKGEGSTDVDLNELIDNLDEDQIASLREKLGIETEAGGAGDEGEGGQAAGENNDDSTQALNDLEKRMEEQMTNLKKSYDDQLAKMKKGNHKKPSNGKGLHEGGQEGKQPTNVKPSLLNMYFTALDNGSISPVEFKNYTGLTVEEAKLQLKASKK